MEVFYFSKKLENLINELDDNLRKRIKVVVEALGIYGNNMKMPFSKSLGKGLFELRVTGADNVRLLYVFYKGSAVIVHIFLKKTDKIPKKELEYARKQIKLLKSI